VTHGELYSRRGCISPDRCYGEQWVLTDELILTPLDESSSSGSSSVSTFYDLFSDGLLHVCTPASPSLSFSTTRVPTFLLGVYDVDPARYCVELREADGYNGRVMIR
jgi:hypothetical protein